MGCSSGRPSQVVLKGSLLSHMSRDCVPILFNRRSFRKPAVFPGFVEVFSKEGFLERMDMEGTPRTCPCSLPSEVHQRRRHREAKPRMKPRMHPRNMLKHPATSVPQWLPFAFRQSNPSPSVFLIGGSCISEKWKG